MLLTYYLQQHWYARYGVPQRDFTASIVLSAVGLAFNLLAKGLIVIRFSATNRLCHIATVLYLLCCVELLCSAGGL